MRLSGEKIAILVLSITAIVIISFLGIFFLENRKLEEELKKNGTSVTKRTAILPNPRESEGQTPSSPNNTPVPQKTNLPTKPNWVEYHTALSFQYPKWMKIASHSDDNWIWHQLTDERGKRLVEVGETYSEGLERAKQWYENLAFNRYNNPIGDAYKGTPPSLNDSDYIVYIIERNNSPNLWVVGIISNFDPKYIPDNPANPRQYAANLIEEIVQTIR